MNYACELTSTSDVTVGDIPGFINIFDISTLGVEIAQFFETNPDIPGIILSKEEKGVFAITRNDFLRVIGRQFGSELFYRRPIQAVVEYLHNKPMLVLPSDCTIQAAMGQCLAREKAEIFGPFLVETTRTGELKMVDFQSLTLASTDILATRNQQLSNEINQRKLLEQKLLRTQRMETVGMLAGGVAHNLNNTLAPITMACFLLEHGLSYEAHTEYVQVIGASAKRAADIVEQLLAFSRGLGAKHSAFSPAALIREVEKFLSMTFPKSIAILTQHPRSLYNIIGDQSQIHQVLLNLCINAKHAMRDVGQIKIEVENYEIEPDDDSLPPEAIPGHFLKISVSDSGCGIAPETIDKIFDPFFTTKEQGKGTGLGLSTALGIVQSHGGFINVESELGKGTTFEVFLPATEKPVGAVADELLTTPQGRGELILVADDEEPIREIAKAILEQNGYEVVTAKNGCEALSTFGKKHREIQLVLTDITMPLMNGVELARRLKKGNPNTKIIVSSGKIDRTDDFALNSVGVNERLWKPYRADQLLRVVHDKIHGPACLVGQ